MTEREAELRARLDALVAPGVVDLLLELVDEHVHARDHEHEDGRSPWLSVCAAASYVGVSEHAMRKLVDRWQLDKHQDCPGGRIRLARSDLDAHLSGLRNHGGAGVQ